MIKVTQFKPYLFHWLFETRVVNCFILWGLKSPDAYWLTLTKFRTPKLNYITLIVT